jgi:hypothetical protein
VRSCTYRWHKDFLELGLPSIQRYGPPASANFRPILTLALARRLQLGTLHGGPPAQCHLYPLNRLHAIADADPAGKLGFRPHELSS